MGRFLTHWSMMFLLVPILGVATFVFAAYGWWPFKADVFWFPSDYSTHGAVTDNLFMFILYLTGAVFIGTSLVLAWFMWKYDARNNHEQVEFVHGSHTLEVVWSILPAVTLLFIAIYQLNAWADNKMDRPKLPSGALKPALAEVTGRQFEWRIRYARKR